MGNLPHKKLTCICGGGTVSGGVSGDGVVKNTIVVGVDWDLGGVPCGEYAVGIGDVYNFTDKKFYKTDGSLVKTYAEIQAELEAKLKVQ